jgi:hypothetical protein
MSQLEEQETARLSSLAVGICQRPHDPSDPLNADLFDPFEKLQMVSIA